MKKLPKIICLEFRKGLAEVSAVFVPQLLSCHPKPCHANWGLPLPPPRGAEAGEGCPHLSPEATGRASACAENRNDCF